MDTVVYVDEQIILRSDCTDGQADMDLHYVYVRAHFMHSTSSGKGGFKPIQIILYISTDSSKSLLSADISIIFQDSVKEQ